MSETPENPTPQTPESPAAEQPGPPPAPSPAPQWAAAPAAPAPAPRTPFRDRLPATLPSVVLVLVGTVFGALLTLGIGALADDDEHHRGPGITEMRWQDDGQGGRGGMGGPGLGPGGGFGR